MTPSGAGTGSPRTELIDAAAELLARSGHEGSVRIQGTSMLPTLREGQTVTVQFSPDDLRPGDVLLFRLGQYLVVHRLVGRTRTTDGEPRLRLRGDGRLALDPPVAPSAVVARAVAIEDGTGLRGLRGPGARLYGRALAWHGRGWAALGRAARWLDRIPLRAAGRRPFQGLVFTVDRVLLRLVHAILFRPCHPRRPRS